MTYCSQAQEGICSYRWPPKALRRPLCFFMTEEAHTQSTGMLTIGKSLDEYSETDLARTS